jgi:hypothetical protein
MTESRFFARSLFSVQSNDAQDDGGPSFALRYEHVIPAKAEIQRAFLWIPDRATLVRNDDAVFHSRPLVRNVIPANPV